tara:strand:+ start:75 stop:383 length:309 start_codon:yes stop_codon:yes gene_type:complete
MKKLFLYSILSLLLPLFLIANDCDYIMDNQKMDIVINHMKRKSDDILKMNTIKAYLQRSCINTNQMLTIMEVFESEEAQNQFFLYSKEYIIDIENYNELISN